MAKALSAMLLLMTAVGVAQSPSVRPAAITVIQAAIQGMLHAKSMLDA